jgi:hypothetical protein
MTVYTVSGPTLTLLGDGTDQTGNLLVSDCHNPITGATGPVTIKVMNSSNADVAFLQWGDGTVPTYYFNGVSGTASGSGANATFDFTVTATGYSATIDVAGEGYIPTETITILGTDLGGATPANDATVTVATANVLNAVDTLDNSSLVPGTGYSNGTGVATTASASGTGLTVDITQTAGIIDTVVVNAAGQDYVVGEVITITGGNGDATIEVLTVTLGGEILTITVAGTELYPQPSPESEIYILPNSTEFIQINGPTAVDSFFLANCASGNVFVTPVQIVS